MKKLSFIRRGDLVGLVREMLGDESFHRRVLQQVTGCEKSQDMNGWDVWYANVEGIAFPEGLSVHKVYATIRNRLSELSPTRQDRIFLRMQNQVLSERDCACLLVETQPEYPQDAQWDKYVDGRSVGHRQIRRMSIELFYSLVTGQSDALEQVLASLPDVIEEATLYREGGN